MADLSKQFKVIFDAAPIGFVIMSSKGDIQYSNPGFQRMLGWRDEELNAVHLAKFVHPDDINEFHASFSQIINQNIHHVRLVSRFVQRDGVVAWWRLDINNVTPDDASPFIFAIVEDITSQKTGEERLMKAKEEAEKATRTKSEFLANMSHEIRTPIHTVTGMTELLLETHLDAEQQEYAKQIRFSADSLLGLINDILDFSKIEAGKFSLELIDFDLHQAVEEAVDMVSLQAHKKQLDTAIYIASDIPRKVTGDPSRLRQIIVNLFNNAVKFTKAGTICCKVELVQRINGTATLMFQVSDTGIGIPKEKLNKLFKAFTQVDSSTSRKFGGTGLGLSICKSLVSMMDGSIGVESEEGQGSIFWYSIPFPVKDDSVEAFESGEKEASVLIVDDNPIVRDILRKYLENYFSTIEEAETGQIALRKMREASEAGKDFSLALIDLVLPGMDGWQIASEINADRRINDTRLILMSPTGEGMEAKMKLLKWFNGYMSKPVRRKELYEAIRTVMEGDIELESMEDDIPVSLAASDEHSGHGYTLLIAEDHIVNQQLFLTILEKMEYSVLLAENGKIAVDMLNTTEPDLIFMDVQMPEMNGYEATSAIRQKGYKKPIVAVTANALKGDREKCLEVGMNDFLTKPFKKKDLIPLLEKWLPKKPRHRPSEKIIHELEEAEAYEDIEEFDEIEELEDVSEMEETESVDETPIFVYEGALDAFMGKADVVDRVVNAYIQKVYEQIRKIRSFLDTEDFETLRTEAHGIKGGSWNLQIMRVGAAASKLEESAKQQDGKACSGLIPKLEAAFEEFCQYAKKIPNLSYS